MIGYGFFIFFYFLSFEWFTSRFKILYKCLLKIYHLLKIIYFNKKKVKDFTFHMLGFFYTEIKRTKYMHPLESVSNF